MYLLLLPDTILDLSDECLVTFCRSLVFGLSIPQRAAREATLIQGGLDGLIQGDLDGRLQPGWPGLLLASGPTESHQGATVGPNCRFESSYRWFFMHYSDSKWCISWLFSSLKRNCLQSFPGIKRKLPFHRKFSSTWFCKYRRSLFPARSPICHQWSKDQ